MQGGGKLDVETEEDDIAVLYDVVLALHADDSLFPRRCEASVVEEVLVIDDLRLDESALKIGMDFSGCLRRFRAFFDGPGAALILACRQETDKPE
jgi:hypothetical protein